MNVKILSLSLTMAIAGLTHSAYAKAFELVTATDSVQLKQTPKKIAVYDLSILDTLNALNIEAQLVPESNYAGSLSKYNANQYIKAGTLFEPNYAKLKQAKPDLILVASRSSKNLDSLKQVAPSLDLTANTNEYIADLQKRSMILAKAFDREALAQQKLQAVLALQSQVKAKTQGKTALMLFAMGDNFMPHAENERFGFVYQLTGFNSVLAAASLNPAARPEAGSPEARALQQQNLEKLKQAVAQQPDYIIVLDRGAVGNGNYTAKDNIAKHPILAQANAVQKQKVIYVNADAWYIIGAGLDNTSVMLNEISQGIQP